MCVFVCLFEQFICMYIRPRPNFLAIKIPAVLEDLTTQDFAWNLWSQKLDQYAHRMGYMAIWKIFGIHEFFIVDKFWHGSKSIVHVYSVRNEGEIEGDRESRMHFTRSPAKGSYFAFSILNPTTLYRASV